LRLVLATSALVAALIGFSTIALAAPQSASRTYCLNDAGDRYIEKASPENCAAYGPGGTFAGGVNLKNLRWRSWGGSSAKARGKECGFHLPCADFRARVRAYRARANCTGGKAFTRLRAKTRFGRSVVRLPRCRSAAFRQARARGGDRDCSDFPNQRKAQKFFIRHNPGRDPHMLDADGDGIACEDNPCPCSTAGPGGGGNGGNGEGDNNGPKPKRDRARVVSVTDGDTIKVRLQGGGRRDVRLIGIDTPEVYGGEECGGPEASRSLKRKLRPGTRVVLISDRSQDNRDRYGRLLRYVEKRKKDINKLQIRRGWAHVYVYGGNPFKRVKKYRGAQRVAKQRDLGAWGECGGRFR
jgi:endonuclease YncB( thermonuclease family)